MGACPSGGSQAGTISGGGRYDGLAEQIGGERVPGVGFGCGTERVVLALEDGRRRAGAAAPCDWFCACEDDAARPRAARAARRRPARAGSRARPTSRAAASRASCATPSGWARACVTVCRAGDGARGIVRHGEAEIAFGDVVDYVERSVRERVSAYRDMLCGEPRAEHAGRELTLSGWVGGRRDHGGLVFIDLRDRTGIVQLVMDPERSPEAHAVGARRCASSASCARAGELVPRSEATRNDQLPTGEVELAVD